MGKGKNGCAGGGARGMQIDQDAAFEMRYEQALNALPLHWHTYGPTMQADTLEALRDVLATDPNGTDWDREPYPRSGSHLPPPTPTAPALMGITGLAQSGKDVLADLAQESFGGVDRFAFSDTILPEVNAYVNQFGYHVDHHNKTEPHWRRLLQAWGSGRRIEDPDYWVRKIHAKIAEHQASGASMVIVTGLRVTEDPDTGEISLRDLDALREVGGHIWNAHRPSNPNNTGHGHHNERALSTLSPDDFEGWILNAVEGDLGAYKANIHAALHGRPQLFHALPDDAPSELRAGQDALRAWVAWRGHQGLAGAPPQEARAYLGDEVFSTWESIVAQEAARRRAELMTAFPAEGQV